MSFFGTGSLKEPLKNESLYCFRPGYFKVQLIFGGAKQFVQGCLPHQS